VGLTWGEGGVHGKGRKTSPLTNSSFGGWRPEGRRGKKKTQNLRTHQCQSHGEEESPPKRLEENGKKKGVQETQNRRQGASRKRKEGKKEEGGENLLLTEV